jgi:CheY-like chemotaxis protein
MTKRILIVDDEVLIALTAVDMVESLGYEAVEAHSGAEALEILSSGKAVDLLITDQSMPRMSGAELIREARLLNPNLSVMVSTGYPEIGGEFGQDVAYLGKPYSEVELSSKIEAAIG